MPVQRGLVCLVHPAGKMNTVRHARAERTTGRGSGAKSESTAGSRPAIDQKPALRPPRRPRRSSQLRIAFDASAAHSCVRQSRPGTAKTARRAGSSAPRRPRSSGVRAQLAAGPPPDRPHARVLPARGDGPRCPGGWPLNPSRPPRPAEPYAPTRRGVHPLQPSAPVQRQQQRDQVVHRDDHRAGPRPGRAPVGHETHVRPQTAAQARET